MTPLKLVRLPFFLMALGPAAWAGQIPSASPTAAPSPASSPQVAPSTSPTLAPAPSPTPEPIDVRSILDQADQHFSRRSIGAIDLVAKPQEVDAAIELYRKALASDSRNIVMLSKLLRALHYRGAYTGLEGEAKKAFFEEGRNLGQHAVDRLEADAAEARGMSRIEALRLVKGSPDLYLWTAVHWGEWGLARGKFASARNGVAGRLRDLAQTLIDLDPLFDDAAGYRMLGRIHAEVPRILFITNWVSHDKGVQYLRRANRSAPDNPVNCAFLAEAIVDHEPEKKDEARKVLEHCVSLTPRPDRVLEDEMYMSDARALLEKLRGPAGR
jgi:tetratricopeptide (TPR) repeat protein